LQERLANDRHQRGFIELRLSGAAIDVHLTHKLTEQRDSLLWIADFDDMGAIRGKGKNRSLNKRHAHGDGVRELVIELHRSGVFADTP
jgi:hypothetical protein